MIQEHLVSKKQSTSNENLVATLRLKLADYFFKHNHNVLHFTL